MLDESFVIENGVLIRRVAPRRGTPYEHTCSKRVYDDVAFAIEQIGAATFTGEDVRERIEKPLTIPFTQVYTALAFLKERGCIVPAHGRRHRAACDFVYEDAMIEWHALREGAPGSN